jgi:hypothetical protein
MVGSVTPEDTLTIELAKDFICAYDEVLIALVNRATGSVV